MEGSTKTTRPRGRPRKVENHSEAADVVTVPAVKDDISEDVMQAQIKENLRSLLKLAAKQGIKVEDLFESPPDEVTKIVETPQVDAEIDEELGLIPEPVRPNGRPLPGTNIVDKDGKIQNWIPWTRNDLAGSKRIKFIPRPIPTMVYPLTDAYGLYKIKLDVNGLTCFLTCGLENEVYEFFYNAYLNGEQAYMELEHFKTHGPDAAPWGMQGPDGRPAWRYTPMALTFGMDEEGKYLIDSPLYERAATNRTSEE